MGRRGLVHDADQGAQLVEYNHLGLLLARVAQDLNCTFAGNVDCHLTDGGGVAVCVCVCVCGGGGDTSMIQPQISLITYNIE